MKKILIVEDDRELKEGICYALQKAGYLTESADSVQNAKKLFLKEGADVILLDVNLPDGEGFDFCKWVKERAQVPVLFLTARDLEEDALCGYEAGAEDYVTKPFSMKILLKKSMSCAETVQNRNTDVLRMDFCVWILMRQKRGSVEKNVF